MIEVHLTGGVKFSMPETLAEISVEQYCEGMQAVDEFIAWQNERLAADLLDPEYQLERLYKMAAMLQNFFTTSPGALALPDVFTLQVGDYAKSLQHSFKLTSLEEFDLDKTEGTLFALWANLVKIVLSFDFAPPGDCMAFLWKGEEYQMKPIQRDRFTGLELPPELTVQAAVEVLELRRKAESMTKAGKHEGKNVQWELLHRELAVLALKEGETLPADDLEFERFAAERAAHFIGIDALTALRVDFFLAGRFGLLNSTATLISFGTLPGQAA